MTWPLLDVIDCSARRALVPHAGNAFGPLRHRRRRPSCAAAGGIRWRAGWPGCSPPTPGSVRGCWSTGWTATRATSTPIWPGSPSCGERWSASVPADPPHIRHQKTVARLREGPDRPAVAAVAVRAHPAGVHRRRAARRAGHPPRSAPVAAAPQRRAVAGARRRAWRDPPPRRHQPSRGPPSAAGNPRPRPARTAAQPAGRPCDRRISSARRQPRPNTLLGWLQSDIAANAVRPQGRKLADGDRSVQVHSCHGPARQIDVLREVLLGLLEDDPTLEPRDIVVMCPDIETYAPLIVADFGLGEWCRRQPSRAPAAGAARRPLTDPDQPAARCGRASC